MQGERTSAPATDGSIDLAIRIGLIILLVYLSWEIVAPLVTIVSWSAILTVALYPLFDRLAQWTGRPRLAAMLVTALCLTIVVAPVAWIGFGMIDGIRFLARGIEADRLPIPLPDESVRNWPFVGERVFQFWSGAVTDIKAELTDLAPLLKPVGTRLLQVSANVMFGLVKFLIAIVIAGFLFRPGPRLVEVLSRFMERVLRPRGMEMVQLTGATIRNVSRGVIGVALLQSLLAGAGFLAAGIPGAGVLAFLSLLLGIIQIGPGIIFLPIILWSWMTMEIASALIFTAYMIPVGLLDNILRPVVVAKGLATPMPVIIIGVIGGTIAYGIIGLFFGPIVLSVAWAVMTAWLYGERDGSGSNDQTQ